MAKLNTDNLYQRQQGGAWYMKFTMLGQAVHKSTHTTDLLTAQGVLKSARDAIHKSVYAPVVEPGTSPNFPLLQDAIDSCYFGKWKTNKDRDKSYSQALTCMTLLQNPTLDKITTLTVRTLRANLQKELKITDATANRYMSALRTVINYASEVDANVVTPKFKQVTESTGRVRWYAHEEEEAVLKACESLGLHEMYDLIVTLADTGFRVSEALNIGKKDAKGKLISEVNLHSNTISSWENKTTASRSLPMSDRVISIMARRGKTPFTITLDQVEDQWKRKVRPAVQMEKDCVMHCWRHTCASRMLQNGATLSEVQKYLGHKSSKTTERYAHLAKDAMAKCISIINQSSSKSVTRNATVVIPKVVTSSHSKGTFSNATC